MPPVPAEHLPDLLLSVNEVAELLSVSPRSVWRFAAAGKLPRPLRVGGRSARWRASEIQRFLDQLAGARPA